MNKFLVLGDTGYLGSYIANFLSKTEQVYGVSRSEFKPNNFTHITGDLSDKSFIKKVLKVASPTHIFIFSGLANLEACESNINNALTLNCLPVTNLIEELDKTELSPQLIFSSTIYVFGHTEKKVYTEEDHSSPVNIYGLTKACLLYTSPSPRDYA